MKAYRNKIEIMAQIATAITNPRPEPLTPYRLMYICELNALQIKQHLEAMKDNGLLDSSNNEIALTVKGRKFLSLCSAISENTDLLKMVKQ